MSSTSTTSETTKRISDEMFAEVERELAASAVPAPAPAELTPPSDWVNEYSKIALPYVWTTAAGIWIAGLMMMNTLIPVTQCIGVGLVATGVLSSIVFAWRSRPAAVKPA